MILATRFTFIVEKSWKNMYFHSKMAWPPATYVVISRNHRNWPPLNLTQNAREGWTNSYWKHQVMMFYPLGNKTQKNLRGGGVASTLPPLYVRGLTYIPLQIQSLITSYWYQMAYSEKNILIQVWPNYRQSQILHWPCGQMHCIQRVLGDNSLLPWTPKWKKTAYTILENIGKLS